MGDTRCMTQKESKGIVTEKVCTTFNNPYFILATKQRCRHMTS